MRKTFSLNLTEFYDDEANLAEQYSPLLGENFIDYPVLEEYGFPTVEEFPGEDMDDDDDVDEEDDPDETDQKAMKRDKNYQGRRPCYVDVLHVTTLKRELLFLIF